MTPLINLTVKEGWQVFNQSCQDCGELYLNAIQLYKEQFGQYLLYFAVAVIIHAIGFILWKKGIILNDKFKWLSTIIIGLELLWVFNLLGLYYMAV